MLASFYIFSLSNDFNWTHDDVLIYYYGSVGNNYGLSCQDFLCEAIKAEKKSANHTCQVEGWKKQKKLLKIQLMI